MGLRFKNYGGHGAQIAHAVEMTYGRGVPGVQRGPGRKWYQGHLAQAPAFIPADEAPPASGLLPASREDLEMDPIDEAQRALTSVLEETPTSWLVYFLRPAIGGAAIFAEKFPLWIRIPAGIWGLWPIWQTLRK